VTSSVVLASAWSSFRPIGLEELNASAGLAQRVDMKYVVPVAVLAGVLEQLRPTHACLAIDGFREFGYSSRYVDSPELGCYHDHRRGVRRRWKARTRVYEDSGQARWEVKLKNGRGLTVKHVLPLGALVDGDLTPEMASFLAEVLRDGYGCSVPDGLMTTLTVGYRRSTLTQLGEENRVTVDSDLQVISDSRQAGLRPDLVLVETKSLSGRSAADRALQAVGVRPSSISKYCAGMAMLHPGLPNHPWRKLLRRYFVSVARLPGNTDHELAA
jgi:hypothetical protein